MTLAENWHRGGGFSLGGRGGRIRATMTPRIRKASKLFPSCRFSVTWYGELRHTLVSLGTCSLIQSDVILCSAGGHCLSPPPAAAPCWSNGHRPKPNTWFCSLAPPSQDPSRPQSSFRLPTIPQKDGLALQSRSPAIRLHLIKPTRNNTPQHAVKALY